MSHNKDDDDEEDKNDDDEDKSDDDADDDDMPVRDKTCVSLLPLRSSAHTPNRLHCWQYIALHTIQCNLHYNAQYTLLTGCTVHCLQYNALQCTVLTSCTLQYTVQCITYKTRH